MYPIPKDQLHHHAYVKGLTKRHNHLLQKSRIAYTMGNIHHFSWKSPSNRYMHAKTEKKGGSPPNTVNMALKFIKIDYKNSHRKKITALYSITVPEFQPWVCISAVTSWRLAL